ncbi:MAG: gliding motility-associated C-terminal domain-containing protein [Culturomica sp.]|nr:gliding motility-associated C-terminal domain-containing protein [Culturomica sp.]
MRYLIFICVCVICSIKGYCHDTLQIVNVPNGVNEFTYFETDTVFYAVKDVENKSDKGEYFGQVKFIPSNNDTAWTFGWSYEGISQAVDNTLDSTQLTVDLLGNGYYSFWADYKDIHIQKDLIVFYVYMDFALSLSDEMNCTYVNIDIDTLFIPRYGSFEGSKNVLYTVAKEGSVPSEIPSVNYRDFLPLNVEGIDHDINVSITIKDKFDFEWMEEIEYVSYIPSADMEITVQDPLADMAGQAPLQVEFTDNGRNAQSWEWFLYQDTVEMKVQSVRLNILDSLLDNVIRYGKDQTYVYMHPGYYPVKMVVTNTNGINACTDTSESVYIVVYESFVDMPNVFTPNDDGVNDIFRAGTQSVEQFSGMILNRWGRTVYEWQDPAGGWDGKINGKDASPGTYYYIIKARGRELHNPPRYIKKGALLLVR